jgi:hypothetical protein
MTRIFPKPADYQSLILSSMFTLTYKPIISEKLNNEMHIQKLID